MYYFFLDRLQLPVAPSALNIKINGRNKTASLINDGEINIIKNPGLTNVDFEFLIPSARYPFVNYSAGSAVNANAILSYLKRLKTNKLPFQFIVTRMRGKSSLLFATNIRVTLEDYEVKESADFGFDQVVAIHLKQYRDYCTKTLEVDKDGNATVKKSRR